MINFLKSDELVVGNIYKEIGAGTGNYKYYIFVQHNTSGYTHTLAFHSSDNLKDLIKKKGTEPTTFFTYSFFNRNVKLTPIGDLAPIKVLEDDTIPRTMRLSEIDGGVVYTVHHEGTRWFAEYVLLSGSTIYRYSLFTKRWLRVHHTEVLNLLEEKYSDVFVTEAFTYPSLPWEIKGDK